MTAFAVLEHKRAQCIWTVESVTTQAFKSSLLRCFFVCFLKMWSFSYISLMQNKTLKEKHTLWKFHQPYSSCYWAYRFGLFPHTISPFLKCWVDLDLNWHMNYTSNNFSFSFFLCITNKSELYAQQSMGFSNISSLYLIDNCWLLSWIRFLGRLLSSTVTPAMMSQKTGLLITTAFIWCIGIH